MSAELDPRAELPPTPENLQKTQQSIDSVTTKVLRKAAQRFIDLVSHEDENQPIKASTWVSEDGTGLLLRFEYKGGHGLGPFKHDYFPREAVRAIVYRGPEVHEAILKENGLDPKKQEASAYSVDIFEECVNAAVVLFQNYRMHLAAALRHSYDDAIEQTKALMLHSIIDGILKLPHDQSVSRKRKFLEDASERAGKESSTRKRKSFVGSFNHLAEPGAEPSTRLRKTRTCKQQEGLLVRQRIVNAILTLLKDNNPKPTKAMIAQEAKLKSHKKRYKDKPKGYKGNVTQTLNDTLNDYGWSLEELIEEAKNLKKASE